MDCGIKAVQKIADAKARGIDFIICDHHNPDDEVPPAVAVLDPKQVDCNYPYKELSGCGVGFKLIQALATGRNQTIDDLCDFFCHIQYAVPLSIPLYSEKSPFPT